MSAGLAPLQSLLSGQGISPFPQIVEGLNPLGNDATDTARSCPLATVVSPEQRDPLRGLPPQPAPIPNSHSAGTSAGAPLFLIKTTTNFAGLVVLAFLSTR